MAFRPPMPVHDPIAQRDRFIERSWIDWLTSLQDDVDESARRAASSIALSSQAAAIGTTAIPSDPLPAGLYRVSWYVRVTRPATTSSSVQVTLTWTDGAVSPTWSGTAVTGNTTTSVDSGAIFVRIDGATPVSYSTSYSSVGATSMQYSLDVSLERVEA